MLHTVNKSPWSHGALQDCLQVIGEGDGLLLLEDGVYAALETSVPAGELTNLATRNVSLYAIDSDLSTRGLSDSLAEGIEAIDYDRFVALATHHKTIQSWY